MPISPRMPLGQRAVAVSAVFSALLFTPAAHAEIVTFVIDSAQSVLTYSGDVNGTVPVVEQAPGSLLTSLVGTFSLDVNFETGEFSFAPGVSFSLPDQPGSFLPFASPAAVAGQAEIAPGFTSYGAFRSVAGGFSSGVLSVDENLLFPASEVTLNLLGIIGIEVPGVIPPTNFANNLNVANGSSGSGQVELTEDTIKLTLPIDISFPLTEAGVTLNSRFQGTVVGVVVPEAGSMALLGMAALGGAAVAVLKRRRPIA